MSRVALAVLLLLVIPGPLRADAWNVFDVQVAGGAAWYLEGFRMCRVDGMGAGSACFQTPGQVISTADRGAILNGKFYASMIVGQDRSVLYAFDGRTAPVPVVEFPGPRLGAVPNIASNGTSLFFTRRRTLGGLELMRTDGTAAGTSVVAMLPTDSVSMSAAAGDKVFFFVHNTERWRASGHFFWASDGTREGTMRIADRGVYDVMPLGRVVLFRSGNELWRSDGTRAGTYRLSSLLDGGIGIRDGYAYFTAGGTIWKTDGTATTALRTAPFRPFHTGIAGERLVLLRIDGALLEVWSASVTTLAEPVRITAIPLHPQASSFGRVVAVAYASGLMFLDVMTPGGRALWRTDGTARGTLRLGTGPSARTTAELGGKLFYFARHPVHGIEPWISDGTVAGTHMLVNVDPEGSVRGVVTDAVSGQPISDAVVETQRFPRLSAVTAANGSYRISGVRPDTDRLAVQAKGYIRAESRPLDVRVNEETVVHVALERGGRVAGRVVDAAGNPLRGIRVRVVLDEYRPQETTTGATGRYELDGLHTGQAWRFEIIASGYAPHVETANAPLLPGETRELDVTLQRPGRLRIRMLDANTGAPLRSTFAELTFHRVSDGLVKRGSVTAATGIAEIELPDGSYHVLGMGEFGSHVTTWYPHTECPDPCGPAVQGTALQVTAGTTREVDFAIRPLLGQIYGVVVDAQTGAQVSLGDVRMRDPNGSTFGPFRWWDDARFETRPLLRPGTYTMSFRPDRDDGSAVYLPSNTPVQVGVGEVVFVELRVTRGATVRGRVTDAATGKPISGVSLFADPGHVFGATDPDGSYAIRGLPSGTYTITARRHGFAETRATVTVTAGEKTTLDLTMARE